MGILDGKVALVTGAGGGLGRAYALMFAREGAKVVVNDLGTARDGSGEGSPLADQVVAQIKEAGGEAVADRGSVSDTNSAEAMVERAVEAFGRIDIVVNNAGILRDKTLLNMTDGMWDIVMDVHAKGTFLVTRAAVRRMRAQGGGGRIINTSSYAGLKGNFGQANYGCAKAGIAGFTRVVALETQRAGITVNAIAPMAKTRMTEDIAAIPEAMQPDDIAPLVVWLVSDAAADVTGRVFGAHGRHYFEYRTEMTDGVELDEPWTAVAVGEQFAAITQVNAPAAGSAEDTPAAQQTPEQMVGEAFARMGEAFMPEKAAGWSAVINFRIGPELVFNAVIDNQTIVTAEGSHATPTCTMTFESVDTFLSVVMGKTNPQQAFMAGKITGDNMSDVMRYATSFDMKKAATAAAATLAGGSQTRKAAKVEPTVEEMVGEAFARMGEAFMPEKAAGWSAVLNFELGPKLRYHAVIEDQTISTAEGSHASPTCTMTFDKAETFLDVVRGKTNPQQAFMAGKIAGDNMSDVMRYATSFDMKKAATAAAATLDGKAQAPKASTGGGSEGMNRERIGTKYRTSADFVRPDDAMAYAKATDDENPHYMQGETPVAPPLYAVRPLMSVLNQLFADSELKVDLLRLVHGEQDMHFHKPLRHWELLAPRAVIEGIEDKSSGQLLTVRQFLMVDGDPACEVLGGFFVRSASGRGSGSSKKAAEPEPDRELVYSEDHQVSADQPARYADASDDHNPIHLDEAVAQSAGHPTVILHGLCTMAFACRAVVNGLCEGEPARLKRLKVRFSKPVLPEQTITTRIWKEEELGDGRIAYGLECVNAHGVKVITHGRAEIGA